MPVQVDKEKPLLTIETVDNNSWKNITKSDGKGVGFELTITSEDLE